MSFDVETEFIFSYFVNFNYIIHIFCFRIHTMWFRPKYIWSFHEKNKKRKQHQRHTNNWLVIILTSEPGQKTHHFLRQYNDLYKLNATHFHYYNIMIQSKIHHHVLHFSLLFCLFLSFTFNVTVNIHQSDIAR